MLKIKGRRGTQARRHDDSNGLVLFFHAFALSRFRAGFIFVMFCAATFMAKAQITVTTLAGDNSSGSLIAAIQSANAQKASPDKPVTILFDNKLAGEIVLSMDLPAIENHISLTGNVVNGKPSITINGSVNPAINEGLKGGVSPGFSLFVVKQGKTFSVENLHLTKSNKSGIVNEGGNVTVKNCMFTYNMGIGSIHGTGGAIQSEAGNLTVSGTYFFYNTGGVGGTDGGIGYGGAGGINVVNGNAVIINSSFVENEGGFGGVGVGSVGGAGAVMVRGGNVAMANSTVAGNFGGGSIVTGASGGCVMLGGNMLISHATIVNNMGGVGLGGFDGVDFCSGGVHVLAGTLTLCSTILAGNQNGADEETDIECQVSGEVRSSGYNLIGKGKVTLNSTGDMQGVAMNQVIATTSEGKYQSGIISGFLPTVSLSANSLAKNKGIEISTLNPVSSTDDGARFFTDAWNAFSSLLKTDQNGTKRAAKPSIGAVE